MTSINRRELATFYSGTDINVLWNANHNLPVIDHPKLGKISPHQYRSQYHGKPCPFCAKRMVHGSFHSTNSKQEAIARNYQYLDSTGKTVINHAVNHSGRYTYFHPHYVTLDHKLNKARCPEQMFDYKNLQIMCWKCNQQKGTNNAYELQHSRSYLQCLAQEILKRYPLL